MKKTIALLCLAFFVGACSSAPKPLPGIPDVPPWRAVSSNCHVEIQIDGQRVTSAEAPPGSEKVVVCDRDFFAEESHRCIDHFEAARVFNHNWQACQALRMVDKDRSSSRLSDLQRKLDSPWRSPWLWGILGLAAGAAIGVGAFAGAK